MTFSTMMIESFLESQDPQTLGKSAWSRMEKLNAILTWALVMIAAVSFAANVLSQHNTASKRFWIGTALLATIANWFSNLFDLAEFQYLALGWVDALLPQLLQYLGTESFDFYFMTMLGLTSSMVWHTDSLTHSLTHRTHACMHA
jgi:hypothetical protein